MNIEVTNLKILKKSKNPKILQKFLMQKICVV